MTQMNPTVGDMEGNVLRIGGWLREAKKAGADLVAFPELAITGYPPEDLLLKPKFLRENRRALQEVIRRSRGLAVVVGCVGESTMSELKSGQPMVVPAGRHELSNAAAVIAGGRLVATYDKRYLPNYGVFDESRYFHPGRKISVVVLGGVAIGVNICEDIWFPEGPTRSQAAAGAEIIVNINASPFQVDKSRLREQMLATRARENGVIVTYTNMVGGQDELVFDGGSLIVDQHGETVARGPQFQEDLVVADLDLDAVFTARLHDSRRRKEKLQPPGPVTRISLPPLPVPVSAVLPPRDVPRLERVDEIFQALTLATRDYVRKNGFKHVVIGLSGGIDSALVAAVAVEALGKENVTGVTMPSPYSSAGTRRDARRLARNLGIEFLTLPISAVMRAASGYHWSQQMRIPSVAYRVWKTRKPVCTLGVSPC